MRTLREAEVSEDANEFVQCGSWGREEEVEPGVETLAGTREEQSSELEASLEPRSEFGQMRRSVGKFLV